ncbi:uroporphyrinogen-III synthase [Helicobacter cynogastricus]|uniref:uroporphyrinogen-III synthase n=1 Tax=Helicobacter cynogastricus TaxID=329937 RepID=UPI000CF1448F|nr:uroporphyrinogen-III synthase [Helicobacter cynogastricus]
MSSIVVVSPTPYKGDLAVSLVCNEIVYLPLQYVNFTLSSPLSAPVALKPLQALVFTSKHAPLALEYSLKHTPALAFLKSLPVFVLAAKSAQTACSLGFHVVFIGQSAQASNFAKEIQAQLPFPALFVRAKTTASNSLDHLPSLIAYENKPLKLPQKYKPKPHSILIFTAPSTYHAFLANFAWEQSYKAIAIGASTFKAFNPAICAFQSPEPSLEACIALAKTLSSCIKIV